MSDLKSLEEKINHVDKTVASIAATIHHMAEKLAETVQHNSTALNNHDSRITGLERSFHIYDGSVKTLNRLISLGGVFVISGVIWLFSQMNDYKKDYALMQHNQQQLAKELDMLRQDLEQLKHERTNKPNNENEYN